MAPGRPIDAVLFDLDGVLVDSYEAWFAVVNDVAQGFGRGPVARGTFAGIWGQGTQADVQTLFPGRTVAEVDAAYARAFGAHASAVRVAPGAAGVFSRLRAAGIRTAVVTNTAHPTAREVLSAVGLRPDILVGGGDAPASKPAPDMLLRACALLEVPPPRAVMVGDTRFDREAAGAAGIRFAGLGTEGETVLPSLEEVLGLVGV